MNNGYSCSLPSSQYVQYSVLVNRPLSNLLVLMYYLTHVMYSFCCCCRRLIDLLALLLIVIVVVVGTYHSAINCTECKAFVCQHSHSPHDVLCHLIVVKWPYIKCAATRGKNS